jgi:hypothetical protein
MQTFLPEGTFEESVKALDNRRLGKQRVETMQLLKALAGGSKGWVNHPACKMWRNWEASLINYGLVVCAEWIFRGFKDTCYDKILAYVDTFGETNDIPDWYSEDFIRSHRSNLIRKDPVFYQPKWPNVPSDLPYIWPVTS